MARVMRVLNFIQKTCRDNARQYFGLNSLLEFSKKEQVDRLLYVSSSEVYGEFSTDRPLLETDYELY